MRQRSEDMSTTKRLLLKVCGTVGGAAVLQVSSCNVQYPPDNTDCSTYGGICIAIPKEADFFDGSFVEETFLDEVAGE